MFVFYHCRVIKLPNGLTALLISDLASILSISSQDDRPAASVGSSMENSPSTPDSMDIYSSNSPFRVVSTQGDAKVPQVRDVTDIVVTGRQIILILETVQC